MIAEALSALKKEILDAAGPQFKAIDPTKDHAILKDGKVEILPSVPQWRNHKAFDLDTIAAFARERPDTAAIWYSRSAVVCLLVDEDRRHRVTMSLHSSPQMVTLAKMEANGLFKQRDLILLLRTTFKSCLGPAGNIIEVLRKISFQHNKEGGSEVLRGKSSVGASLRSELTGTGALPEYVTLDVPVFDAGSLALITAKVECVLDPEEQTESFRLQPLPGQIEKAITAGEESLRVSIEQLLEGADVSVFYGEP